MSGRGGRDAGGGGDGAEVPARRPRAAPDAGPKGPGGGRRPPAPSRRETVRGVARELEAGGEEAGIDDPRLEAERLVAHALDLDRAELARTGGRPMDPARARRLARAVRRRLAGEPLQHIEGTVHFRELVLSADARALIPRPETEQLVDRIAAWAGERRDTGAAGGSRVVTAGRRRGRRVRAGPLLDAALDIGTGSGAIALSLVAEGIVRRAVGIDAAPAALEQAAENRSASGLGPGEVELRPVPGGMWEAVGEEERFDLVVSNPPYVRDAELERLPAQIREHEPRRALAGGADGLDVVREIVSEAAAHLRPGGALFLEIGEGQGEAVRRLLEHAGGWHDVEIGRDLAGRERFIRARPGPGGEERSEVEVQEG